MVFDSKFSPRWYVEVHLVHSPSSCSRKLMFPQPFDDHNGGSIQFSRPWHGRHSSLD